MLQLDKTKIIFCFFAATMLTTSFR